MTKKQRALEVIERLKKEYPDAGCTLDYDQAWKLLVSVRLAAQCTDARVNVVVEGLYERASAKCHGFLQHQAGIGVELGNRVPGDGTGRLIKFNKRTI